MKSPKIYFRDTGLLHQLSTIPNFEALQGNQLIGASWEGYVIEQIRRAVDASWQFYFYRTIAGAETDLVLISPNGTMTCIEIKYATAPAIAKGFLPKCRGFETCASVCDCAGRYAVFFER